MSWELRSRLFRAASAYHAALARYARAMQRGNDVETPVQEVVATGLQYRLALEAVLAHPAVDASQEASALNSVYQLRRIQACTCARYNLPRR